MRVYVSHDRHIVFFFQAEDGIRDLTVTGVQTCALPISRSRVWSCPPWRGDGRYLDVGCGSGASLGVAQALGWRVAGIEMDTAAAEKARRFTEEIYVGDVRSAPFGRASFDVVTAFHVLEHVPDPVAGGGHKLRWLGGPGARGVPGPHAGGPPGRAVRPPW